VNLSEFRDLDLSDVSSWPTPVKVLGAALACVAILAAGYYFFIKDKITELDQAERQELELRQAFLKKKALAVNLPAYQRQMEEMEETFGVMLRQLPNRTEIPELLIDITQAGLGRGLQFELFKPGAKRNHEFYAELPISIQVVGDYHELGEFVSDLAALPRIVSLGNLTISRVGADRLRMSATAITYHYLDENEIQAQRAKPTGAQRPRTRR
jgi:type IV pilus assembly protein PilO